MHNFGVIVQKNMYNLYIFCAIFMLFYVILPSLSIVIEYLFCITMELTKTRGNL